GPATVTADLKILLHGEAGKDPAAFRHQHDAEVDQRVRRPATDRPPLELDRLRRYREGPGERSQERRLARPVGADHGPALAPTHLERHIEEGLEAAVERREVARPQQRHGTSIPR